MKKIGIITITLAISFIFSISCISASEITGRLGNQGVIPMNPSNPTVSIVEREITVTWSAVAGVEGYKVYRIKDGEPAELVADNVSGLTYKDTDLDDGLYSYQIQSFVDNLFSDIEDILPTEPIKVETPVTPTPTPAPASTPVSSGGGGGGGGGSSSATTPVSSYLSEAAKKVDANKDNKIDIMDFNTLMVNWGKEETNNIADFDKNGKVDIFDFNLLMINWTA